jgi:hypothetical protein
MEATRRLGLRLMRSYVAAICTALLVASCTRYTDPCFTPPSVIEDLRVLALSVDPPSPVADLATGNVESVRLRALFARPGGPGGTIEVSWAVCIPGPEPLCPEEAIVARDHEWGRDSWVEIRMSPDMIAAAIAADPLRGAGGIRVLATLRVAGAVPDAVSTPIIFALPGQPRNRPPTVAAVRVAREGFAYGDASVGVDMFSSSPHGLRPVLAPGAIEEYDTTDFSGRLVHLRERILYSFYATSGLAIGRLQHGTTGLVIYYGNGSDSEAEEPPAGTPDPSAGLIPLTALGSGTLWVVARDSRGAAAWLEVPVRVTGVDPRCANGAFPPFFDCVQASFGCP